MYTEFGSSGGIVRVPMIWETSSQSSCMGNEHKKQPEATQGPPLYVRTYLEVYIGSMYSLFNISSFNQTLPT